MGSVKYIFLAKEKKIEKTKKKDTGSRHLSSLLTLLARYSFEIYKPMYGKLPLSTDAYIYVSISLRCLGNYVRLKGFFICLSAYFCASVNVYGLPVSPYIFGLSSICFLLWLSCISCLSLIDYF